MLVIAATERELTGVDPAAADVLVCGIGPVEAAAATARSLAAREPRVVLHVGLAGSRSFVAPGLVLGSESVYCDPDSALVPARALPDGALLERARAALPHARVCAIGTSARVGGTAGCEVEVEAMEGFAVLRACELAGVPALEVRALANEIDEPDRGRWRFDEALEVLRDALPALLEALGE